MSAAPPDHLRRAAVPVLAAAALLVVLIAGALAIERLSLRPGVIVPAPARTEVPAPSGPPVIVAAGDIASCTREHDSATAALVEAIPGTVVTLGDNAYEAGRPEEFRDCYGPTWGRFRDRTRPVPGNHDYGTPGARAYYEYFAPIAGTPGSSWYAFDLGSWRIYALDSNCDQTGGCGEGSPQLEWLRTDLEAEPRDCVLAYWHHARFSSGRYRDGTMVTPFWEVLHAAGADVVLSAHDHLYERFAPQDPDGTADAERGIRQFVVGTGGDDLYRIEDVRPNSEVREDESHGLLELRLGDGEFTWRFHAVAPSTFSDAGDASCH